MRRVGGGQQDVNPGNPVVKNPVKESVGMDSFGEDLEESSMGMVDGVSSGISIKKVWA